MYAYSIHGHFKGEVFFSGKHSKHFKQVSTYEEHILKDRILRGSLCLCVYQTCEEHFNTSRVGPTQLYWRHRMIM